MRTPAEIHLSRLHRLLNAIEAELMRFSLDDMQMILEALRTWEPEHDFTTGMRTELLVDFLKKQNHKD